MSSREVGSSYAEFARQYYPYVKDFLNIASEIMSPDTMNPGPGMIGKDPFEPDLANHPGLYITYRIAKHAYKTGWPYHLVVNQYLDLRASGLHIPPNRMTVIKRMVPTQAAIWEEHPVLLSPAQVSGLKLEMLLCILRGDERLPSAMAGISIDQVKPQVIQQQDGAYRKAAKGYKDLIKNAVEGDETAVQALSKKLIYEKTFLIGLKRLCGSVFISELEYTRETQAHRYACIVELNTLEKIRLEKMNFALKEAIPPLIEHLVELEQRNLTDRTAQDKLWQLKRVYQVHFPEEALPDEQTINRLLPPESEMRAKFVNAAKAVV